MLFGMLWSDKFATTFRRSQNADDAFRAGALPRTADLVSERRL